MASAARPHIFFLLADDLGWAELGYTRRTPTREVSTPTIDSLVADGIELQHSYAFKFCSPSRSALQSGRNPVHVNVNNYMPTMRNRANPVSGFAGIPTEMTGLGTLMQKAGYNTIFAGKWDAGMATPRHTPRGRGYNSALSYFHHTNDYWTLQAAFGEGCKTNSTGHTWHSYVKQQQPTASTAAASTAAASAALITSTAASSATYDVRDGYLASGDEFIPKRAATLAQAEQLCGASARCRGFTFHAYDRRPPVLHTRPNARVVHALQGFTPRRLLRLLMLLSSHLGRLLHVHVLMPRA